MAAEKSREVLWDTPLGLTILWYALAGVSVLVFLYGVARPVAKYRHGNRDGLPPLRELPGRVWRATATLYEHASIRRRDPYVGWAHRGIFYGWVVLAIGTVIVALDHDVVHPLFGVHFWTGNFYLGYKAALNALGTALIIGVLMMMVRRAFIRPRKLDYTRPDRAPGDPQYDRRAYRIGDWVFVILLLIIALTGYLLEGVRLAMDQPGYEAYQFGGWVVAQAFTGLSDGTLGDIRHGVWWFHGLLAIAFVAAIPYTKAAHMLSSYASLILRDPDAKRRLRVIPPERADQPAGYGTLADFSALHLLQLDACTKCGKCHEACPANAMGRPLSPRDVVLELREEANAAASARGVGGVLGSLLRAPTGDGLADRPVIGHDRVRPETAWACMQCSACVEICPVGIEQAPIINQLRRRLVEEGELDTNLQSTLQVIHKSGNSFGENRRRRGRWAKELDFQVKDARKEPVDVLWFVGDYASFDPRSQRVTQAIARLLHGAGVDFGILYDAERNSGNDVRRVGEEGLFEMLAEENLATLQACDFQRIMTSDPHSLNTLRNEYPALGDESWPVLHHTTLLLELIDGGHLDVRDRLSYKVTYHDPCHLGRMNGEYDNPRRIMELLGCELREMPRNRDNSFCCGAGGGRIWIPDQPGGERPSENRIREALGLGDDLDFFVVSCPKDVTMYEDAIKTSGNADRLELRELTELVEEALVAARRPATVGG
ncbi:heterodisulfide reductase-related iron-sulfur binding cluster [Capillimicrobium parvum]|uniref:Iron-sulfur-binding oxidoreductase FadF n=1 Tax=Capillimicrobium parvum TaxID=2884022 RepID=A0A9E6XU77_9ACTN|nr:heterodisulfide reductase-related iron-sulfur binding cluster [Capillimicrobium parvum]UGS34208.1 putative iron-sulfur-binding oxidoreductase FadF [Capillimicrobium parvum]